jgi:hypothetical protein
MKNQKHHHKKYEDIMKILINYKIMKKFKLFLINLIAETRRRRD